ncbi:MAG TPA: molybdopterin-dependent oxidoreductase [Candidatus Dormibacteraeota bacterium]|nr:molybdopterin-dependent oxidoreductase [Candidatus Dormibacteraeota bacterium]
MSAATLDRLLAVLIGAQLLTGLLTLRAGSPPTAPLFVVHGVLGGALATAVVLKLRHSLPRAIAARRWGAIMLALALALAASAALAGGFVWVASGRILSIGPWTILTIHVLAALTLVPIAIAHLVPRRWRVLRRPRRPAGTALVSRRTALGMGALAAVGVVAWAASNAFDALAGGVRRFTGSRWLPDGGVPPATTFFGEGTTPIDVQRWRLAVTGLVARPLDLSLADLAGLGEVERDEVLDCTSGWALRTTWRGVALGDVLAAAEVRDGATRVVVRAVTGWFAELPLGEARSALLATGVAGEALRHGNGAPCRLVAPDRRGLEWVKWVGEIEVA